MPTDHDERTRILAGIRERCLALPETSELAANAEDAYAEVAPSRLVEAAQTGRRPGRG